MQNLVHYVVYIVSKGRFCFTGKKVRAISNEHAEKLLSKKTVIKDYPPDLFLILIIINLLISRILYIQKKDFLIKLFYVNIVGNF